MKFLTPLTKALLVNAFIFISVVLAYRYVGLWFILGVLLGMMVGSWVCMKLLFDSRHMAPIRNMIVRQEMAKNEV